MATIIKKILGGTQAEIDDVSTLGVLANQNLDEEVLVLNKTTGGMSVVGASNALTSVGGGFVKVNVTGDWTDAGEFADDLFMALGLEAAPDLAGTIDQLVFSLMAASAVDFAVYTYEDDGGAITGQFASVPEVGDVVYIVGIAVGAGS